jgi:hypothetical protein
VLAIALAGLLATGSDPRGEAAFRKAVELVGRFQDDAARKAFSAILRSSPPESLAARCHLYLGRIAVDGLDAKTAVAEFLQALRLDPFIDAGAEMSPKGRMLFERARQRYAQGPPAAPDAEGLAPRTPPAGEADSGLLPLSEAPAAAIESPPAEAPARGHTLGIGLLAGGLALGVLTGISALEIVHYNGAYAGPANQSPGTVAASPTLSQAQSQAGVWQAVEIASAILAVAGVGAAAFTW